MVFIPRRKPRKRSQQLGARTPNFQATVSKEGMHYEAWGNILDNLSNKLAPAMLSFYKEQNEDRAKSALNNSKAGLVDLVTNLSEDATPEDLDIAVEEYHDGVKSKEWYSESEGAFGSEFNLAAKSAKANYKLRYFKEKLPQLMESKNKNSILSFKTGFGELDLSPENKVKRLSRVNTLFDEVKENHLTEYKLKNGIDTDVILDEKEVEKALSTGSYADRKMAAEKVVKDIYYKKVEDEFARIAVDKGLDSVQLQKVIRHYSGAEESDDELREVLEIDDGSFLFLDELGELEDQLFGENKKEIFSKISKTPDEIKKLKHSDESYRHLQESREHDKKQKKRFNEIQKASDSLGTSLYNKNKKAYDKARAILVGYGQKVLKFEAVKDKDSIDVKKALANQIAADNELERQEKLRVHNTSQKLSTILRHQLKNKQITQTQAESNWDDHRNKAIQAGVTVVPFKEVQASMDLHNSKALYSVSSRAQKAVDRKDNLKQRERRDEDYGRQDDRRKHQVGMNGAKNKDEYEKSRKAMAGTGISISRIPTWEKSKTIEHRSDKATRELMIFRNVVGWVDSGKITVKDGKYSDLIGDIEKIKTFDNNEPINKLDILNIMNTAQKYSKVKGGEARTKIKKFNKVIDATLDKLRKFQRPSLDAMQFPPSDMLGYRSAAGKGEPYFPKLKNQIDEIKIRLQDKMDILLDDIKLGNLSYDKDGPKTLNSRLNAIITNEVYTPLKAIVIGDIKEGFIDIPMYKRARNKDTPKLIDAFSSDNFENSSLEDRNEILEKLESALLKEYQVKKKNYNNAVKNLEEGDRRSRIRPEMKKMQKAIFGIKTLLDMPLEIDASSGIHKSARSSDLDTKFSSDNRSYSLSVSAATKKKKKKGEK